MYRIYKEWSGNSKKPVRLANGTEHGVQFGTDALRSYGKQYDEKNKVYKDKPLHDWASHPSDGFRYMAVGLGVRYNMKTTKTVGL